MSLLDKMNKAKESNVEIDGITFTIKRPTNHQAINDILTQDPKTKELVLVVSSKFMLENFVVNWSGINECDLIPGGSPEPVPFSTEVFIAWAEDHLNIWPILSKAIINAFLDYQNAQDEALGKQKPG